MAIVTVGYQAVAWIKVDTESKQILDAYVRSSSVEETVNLPAFDEGTDETASPELAAYARRVIDQAKWPGLRAEEG